MIDVAKIKARYNDAKQTAEDEPWNFGADENLIALVISDFPALVTEIERLRAALEKIAKAERQLGSAYAKDTIDVARAALSLKEAPDV